MVKYYVALAFLLHDFQGYKLEKKHCLTLMDDGTERHPDKQGIRDGFKQVLPKHHRQIFSTCCVVVNVPDMTRRMEFRIRLLVCHASSVLELFLVRYVED